MSQRLERHERFFHINFLVPLLHISQKEKMKHNQLNNKEDSLCVCKKKPHVLTHTHTLKMLNYISFYVSFVCFVHILTLPGFSDARYKEESSRTVGLWVFFGHAFSSDFQHVQQIVKEAKHTQIPSLLTTPLKKKQVERRVC